MAALRPMLSLVREETTLLTSELASAGRVAMSESAASGAGRIAAEMNPLAVRQAVEAGVKESTGLGGMGLKQALEVSAKDVGSTTLLSRQAVEATIKDGAGESVLSQHLSLTPRPTNILQAQPNFSTTTSSTQSIIASTIEENVGQTLKEVLGNAGQTGVEEQMDQVVEIAKVMARGSGEAGAGGSGGGVVLKGVEEAAREIAA